MCIRDSNYYHYRTSNNAADRLYKEYDSSTTPEDLINYRPRINRYADRMDRANRNMRIIRIISFAYWFGNMIHTWQVAPRKIEVEPSSILLTMNPLIQEVGLKISIALKYKYFIYGLFIIVNHDMLDNHYFIL